MDGIKASSIYLIRFCGGACGAMGALGLGVAVFEIAFNAYTEATAVRAFMQLCMIPAAAYLVALDMVVPEQEASLVQKIKIVSKVFRTRPSGMGLWRPRTKFCSCRGAKMIHRVGQKSRSKSPHFDLKVRYFWHSRKFPRQN